MASVFDKYASVAIASLSEYDSPELEAALDSALGSIGAWELIKPGMHVVIKANLVSAMKPSEAGTTHPKLLYALAKRLIECGASVTLGDSPGGLYNSAFVGRVYKVTGMHALTELGVKLNDDFSEKSASYAEAKVLHSFTYTGYLDSADLIINFAKLKSHGMMGMSCAAKNMFGAIPGVIKPEYHYRFPKYEDFANMILDLDEYFHPEISIADAVWGMEGNGPTAGTPKKIGCILASRSPHTLDLAAAKMLGYTVNDLPLLVAAKERGLIPDTAEELNIIGDIEPFIIKDFEHVVERRSLEFSGTGKNPVKRFFAKIAAAILKTKPYLVKKMCVGCGICKNICPAKAITIENGKAKIQRKDCIRCFCCQEFCPKSAMKVRRTFIANLFHSENKKKK